MTKYKQIRFFDVTAKKTNKIEYLQRQVNDATTVVAKAEATYNSFVEKAATFSNLYNEAEADLQTAEGYWKLFLQVKADLKALNETADEANLVAVDAFHGVKNLIDCWEQVTTDTIKAAEAITLTADYIQKRKAANPLISDDLVNDAIAAANAAQKTVSAVVKAFKDALAALSSSTQANNSTELTDVYINLAITALLEQKLDEIDPAIQTTLTTELSQAAITGNDLVTIQSLMHPPLETSLSKSLSDAQNKSAMALTASEAANREMNKAKEELAQAQASLSTWEAALTAAETAVAG